MRTSVYLHVPFCVVKCGYCDFNSYEVDDRAALDVFLDGLERELEITWLPDAPGSVFIGGGTPTFLDEPRLERFFAIVGRHIDLAACPEVTIEANPESTTAAKGRIARTAGVDRVSIGAQSFAAEALAFLDRAHSADDTRQAVAAMREAGFENLSLDLMFGVPGADLAGWRRDLAAALELQPDHLSCYNLTFEPGTRLHRDREQGRVRPNDGEVDREMFLWTRETLQDAGYEPYEISNFAGRGGPCRHNDHYWLQGNYVGIGPGASSHRDGVRGTNLKPLGAWRTSLDRGLPPVAEAETLHPAQRAAEALWLGIRRRDGVDLGAIADRLGDTVVARFDAVISALRDEGLVRLDGQHVQLTADGVLFADSVGERLLGGADG